MISPEGAGVSQGPGAPSLLLRRAHISPKPPCDTGLLAQRALPGFITRSILILRVLVRGGSTGCRRRISIYTRGGSPDLSPHCSPPALLSVCKWHSYNCSLLVQEQACKKARRGSSQSQEVQYSSRNKPAEVQGERTGNEEGLMFHAEFRGVYLLGTKSGFIYAAS